MELTDCPELTPGRLYYVRFRIPVIHRQDREFVGKFVHRVGDSVEGPTLTFLVNGSRTTTELKVAHISVVEPTGRHSFPPRKVDALPEVTYATPQPTKSSG